MICMTVSYLKGPDTHFDISHYVEKHIPLAMHMLRDKCGVSVKKIEIFSDCVGKGEIEHRRDYHCVCHLYFDNYADIEKFLNLRDVDEDSVKEMREGIQKFTNVEPHAYVSQVSQLKTTQVFEKARKLLDP